MLFSLITCKEETPGVTAATPVKANKQRGSPPYTSFSQQIFKVYVSFFLNKCETFVFSSLFYSPPEHFQ